ncbi:hypothetical protein QBC40DRAFT_319559 [Triangularia verruculosa]|uniref:Uncharacterized protein n=1 Tax=Triangularia verruculosa TaxID=2587418 RepID=A0AAN7AY84_9PEZI|nr:hypothetical protein QBC40DRAFT_319559 [Triangularia verruculosa]
MGSTSILRGCRVSISILVDFLDANIHHRTYGTPSFYQDHPDKDPISKLLFLRVSADKNTFRVLIPSVEGWEVTVTAHRELKLADDLPEEVPPGFGELRRDILSFGTGDDEEDGKMAVYMATTNQSRGFHVSSWIRDNPQYCDQCEAVFESSAEEMACFKRRQQRCEVYGSSEPACPSSSFKTSAHRGGEVLIISSNGRSTVRPTPESPW